MKTLNLHNNDSSYPSLALKNKRIFAYISLISHKGFEISKYISNIVLNSDPPKGSERMDKKHLFILNISLEINSLLYTFHIKRCLLFECYIRVFVFKIL